MALDPDLLDAVDDFAHAVWDVVMFARNHHLTTRTPHDLLLHGSAIADPIVDLRLICEQILHRMSTDLFGDYHDPRIELLAHQILDGATMMARRSYGRSDGTSGRKSTIE